MRVALITQEYIPFSTGFGSAIHVSSLIETLNTRGHEVHIVCYAFKPQDGKAALSPAAYAESLKRWTDRGVRIHTIDKYPTPPENVWRQRADMVRKMASPRITDFFYGPNYKADLSRLLNEIKPDAIIPWMIEGVSATAPPFSPKTPRMAFMTDLDHLDRQLRRQYRPAQSAKGKMYQRADVVAERSLIGMMVSLLKGCDLVYDHAAHHAEWLRERGVKDVKYLPVPVMDNAGPDWEAARDRAQAQNALPRVSLIGNVSGIATLPGIVLLAEEILPAMERLLGTEGFEVHIIGGGKLPAALEPMLKKPYVKRRGYVEDIHAEFRASDIFLVPTPIDIGFRTRICEGFSFGCCVVAHHANGLGMPELQNEKNALVSDTGVGLAEATARALRDPALRRTLGAAGRCCYEEELQGSVVCGKMVDSLESLVKAA